ncbi:MAG: DUF2336 domain-containing protein [Rhodospirillaceae bacterium]
MSGLLSGLISLGRRVAGAPADYEAAKAQAAAADAAVRRRLAGRTDVQPEILYFLAADTDAGVRREIAANAATPVQADALLADDGDDDVRCIVAGKVARLAPGLTDEQRSRAGDIVAGILERLAQDQTARVRRVLAEELRSAGGVPRTVVETLACDPDIAVSGPVLRESPLLSDAFLLEIISSRPVREALHAIAGRAGLGETVSDAIAATDDRDAIATLLGNRSAQIREDTLDRLVAGAADVEAWHEPLVDRPSLSLRAADALSRFVADALLEKLAHRTDLDPAVLRSVGEKVRRRTGAPPGSGSGEERETAEERVRRLHAGGALTEAAVKAAMMRGERSFVLEAISALGGLPSAVVQKAFALGASKGVAAVCWRAGLTADLAHQLQLRLARIAPADALKPIGGAYALPDGDLNWQLEFLGA